MLPNKLDQYFRDKLLDHSTKVSPNTWKLIHAGLLRHKAFHFWKWYVAGPTVVVVAVTSHLILAQLNRRANARTGTSIHSTTQPTATPDQAAATSETTPPVTPTTNAPTTTAPIGNATAAAATAASSTAPTTNTPTTASTPKPNSSTINTRHTTTRHTTTRHSTNTRLAAGTRTHREPRSRSQTVLLAPDASTAQPADFATHPFRLPAPPAGPTTRLVIVHPATRLAITAQTPNPGSHKNGIILGTPYNHTSRWRFDGYASPEYFSFKEFGFSYGAGARATIVLKQHLTITAGLQYLKVDVQAKQKDDSLNSLFPGIFNNIQVPLLIGYTTGNQRFSVTVNAGAIFSLYAEAKGRLKDYGWPNRNGITSYLGFNFATRVNDRISLFAEPYVKTWYPQKTQNLPPHLFSTGISVGLRFDLK